MFRRNLCHCGMAMLIVSFDIGLDNGINETYTFNVTTHDTGVSCVLDCHAACCLKE